MTVIKTGIQKRVMSKEMQPVFAVKDEWDNKTLEAAILKSEKGGKIVPKAKLSAYSDRVVSRKVEVERATEE